jgi:hypothetical protein
MMGCQRRGPVRGGRLIENPKFCPRLKVADLSCSSVHTTWLADEPAPQARRLHGTPSLPTLPLTSPCRATTSDPGVRSVVMVFGRQPQPISASG